VVLLGSGASSHSLRIFSGNLPFDLGGDPATDAERYESLSSGLVDEASSSPGDIRVLVAAGPFADLAPGETVVVDVAFVTGATESELMSNATNAVRLAQGQSFDRDGDPATGIDGREFRVPWYLGHGNATKRAGHRLHLSASPTPFNPRVQLSFELPSAGPARIDAYDVRGRHVATVLDRVMDAGPGEVTWSGSDVRDRPVSSGAYFFRLQHGGKTDTARAVIVR
jgi:hypothetical protein